MQVVAPDYLTLFWTRVWRNSDVLLNYSAVLIYKSRMFTLHTTQTITHTFRIVHAVARPYEYAWKELHPYVLISDKVVLKMESCFVETSWLKFHKYVLKLHNQWRHTDKMHYLVYILSFPLQLLSWKKIGEEKSF